MSGRLNLARLDRQRAEISAIELADIQAGNQLPELASTLEACNCECSLSTSFDVWNAVNLSTNCPCDSPWVVFGLMWGEGPPGPPLP
jgi:hypothetical protein